MKIPQPTKVEISNDLITEDEFDDLLEQLHGPSGAPGVVAKPLVTLDPDLITEDEFDSLLDELHGPSGVPGLNSGVGDSVVADANAEFDQLLGDGAPSASPSVEQASAGISVDLITDDEFEHLLDDLQASGQGAFSPDVTPAPVAPPEQPKPKRQRLLRHLNPSSQNR